MKSDLEIIEEKMLKKFKENFKVESIGEAILESETISYKGKRWLREDTCVSISEIELKLEEIDNEYNERNKNDNNEWWITNEIFGYAEEKLKELIEERKNKYDEKEN